MVNIIHNPEDYSVGSELLEQPGQGTAVYKWGFIRVDISGVLAGESGGPSSTGGCWVLTASQGQAGQGRQDQQQISTLWVWHIVSHGKIIGDRSGFSPVADGVFLRNNQNQPAKRPQGGYFLGGPYFTEQP
jgi:hypothetical protein